MRGNFVETLIGALVVLIAASFLFFAYRSAGVAKVGGYPVQAKFDRVDGLVVGSDVRLSGIKIGTITAQTLDPDSFRAVVRFDVDSGIKLPDDSSAKIASNGLLGANYLSVEPGGSDTYLQPNGEIKFTQGSINLLDLIAQAIFGATGGKSSATTPATPAPAPATPAPAPSSN